MARVVMSETGQRFLVRDTSQDLHTKFGFFKKADLKKKSGSVIKTNTGKAFTVFDASFFDLYGKMRRDAQIIPRKDIGLIITETGLGKDSLVVEAGAGSGGTTCFLANIVKKIVTYEIREDFIDIVAENAKAMGLKNATLKHKNIYDGITEKNVDLVLLDLPEPWKALEPAASALKVGGFVVSYSPTIPQTMDFVEAARKQDRFVFMKTVEISEREWDVADRKVRPKSQGIGHSGFLTFLRRVK